jgi:hypothetical protein
MNTLTRNDPGSALHATFSSVARREWPLVEAAVVPTAFLALA